MIYRALVRPILYTLPAEAAHRLSFAALRAVAAVPPARAVLRAACVPAADGLAVEALGLRFPTPVGLAAGFDKNAVGIDALAALGFGHVEVGTLTGEPQPGNPAPRLFRLPRDQALVNRMGFNNQGSAAAVPRIAAASGSIVVGVNIGKSKRVAEEHAIDDYVASARRVAPVADYVVVNVSSPNTPGLRDLQSIHKLRPLLSAVRVALDEASPRRRPLLVKIAPDLDDHDVLAVTDLALELRLDGIVATNTTIRRDGLATSPARLAAIGAGGLSGTPLRPRALEVLRLIRGRSGRELTLIAAGGIRDAAEAYRRIRAGASVVQVYTGLVYEGPLLPRRIALGVLACARADGFATVAEAIGADAETNGRATASRDV